MKNINRLVNSQLVRSIESYDKLSQTVYELLHLNKEKHNLWVVIKQQNLTILTDNPYLGTQLQYQQQNICDELNRQYLLQLKNTKVKIIPPKGERKVSKEKCYVISDKAGQVLASIADDIEDEELKESLIKLSKGNQGISD